MNLSRFVFRGALGGLIGGPLFLIGLTLHDFYRLGYTPYSGALQIMALPYMLVVGLVLGSLTGCIVWISECKAKVHLPMIVRAMLGAGFVFTLVSLIQMLMVDHKWHAPSDRLESLINGIVFVTTLGSLPAIIALPRTANPDD